MLGPCAAYAVYVLWSNPAEPIVSEDSRFYLTMSPLVPMGYSAVLALFGAKGTTIVQPLVCAAAFAWIGLETLFITARAWMAILLVVALAMTPQLTTFHHTILTESLYISATLLFIASSMRFVRRPSWIGAAVASTSAGAAAVLRNSGVALAPALLFLIAIERSRLPRGPLRIVAAALLPVAFIVSAERLSAGIVHGDRLTSLLGSHLFAKAALIDAPAGAAGSDSSNGSLRMQMDRNLDQAYRPIRDLLREAPLETEIVLTLYYEACLQGPCTTDLLPASALPEAQFRALLRDAAVARIARAPLGFARLTTLHYASLWMAYKQQHPRIAPALNWFTAAHRPLPFEGRTFAVDPGTPLAFVPRPAARLIDLAVLIAGLVTAAAVIAGLAAAASRRLRAPDSLAIAAASSMAGHGQLLFSAMFAAGISRFMLAAWPSIVVGCLFSLAAMRDLAVRRLPG